MGNKLWFRSEAATVSALILVFSLFGCDKPDGQNDVTWEIEGNDVRVIEKFMDREGDRRQLFPAEHIEKVTVSGHVVTVRSKGETFEVYCFDEKQAGELADVLGKSMKKMEN